MGKNYKIVFRKSAEKQLLKLPKETARNILKQIQSLSANPVPSRSKKMAGFDNVFRLRFRNYRIVYRIEKDELIIEIIKIGHRQNIYK
ncbi:type II toxin-antitoxin system RelE family toxin [Maribellus sediminis]|uniref:type II toxin-antitoxin system RelE family toxin n=1 Tax=Maribellus sediminis TaxID=2696285 RepID=UPI00142F55A8|nr:type II toxin-antitoxin system RelE/ParE family toxin [Maribellus sediminis]